MGARARTHLFRSKRALALASYLRRARVVSEERSATTPADKLASSAPQGRGATSSGRCSRRRRQIASGSPSPISRSAAPSSHTTRSSAASSRRCWRRAPRSCSSTGAATRTRERDRVLSGRPRHRARTEPRAPRDDVTLWRRLEPVQPHQDPGRAHRWSAEDDPCATRSSAGPRRSARRTTRRRRSTALVKGRAAGRRTARQQRFRRGREPETPKVRHALELLASPQRSCCAITGDASSTR